MAYTEAEQAVLLVCTRGPQVQPQVLGLPHRQLLDGNGHPPNLIILVQCMMLQQDCCQLLMLGLVHQKLKVLVPPEKSKVGSECVVSGER